MLNMFGLVLENLDHLWRRAYVLEVLVYESFYSTKLLPSRFRSSILQTPCCKFDRTFSSVIPMQLSWVGDDNNMRKMPMM